MNDTVTSQDDGRRNLSRVQRLYHAEAAHRLVPWPIAAAALRTWAALDWRRRSQVRRDVLRHMAYLLPEGTSETELEAAARRYVVENYYRVERWHRPWQTTRHPPAGLDALRKVHEAGRGVMISFLHFGETHAPFGAIARAGVPFHMPIHDTLTAPDLDWLQAGIINTLTVSPDAHLFAATGSSRHIRSLLQAGEVVAVASDIPNTSFVEVLGRRVGMSLGAAKLAHDCNALVFPLVATRVGWRPSWRFDPPIDPTEHEDPLSLLQEMMRHQEPALRRWPQALDHPLRRWTPEPAFAEEIGWDISRPMSM